VKVINVGRWPPPYGGVSSHIQRLHKFLLEKGVNSIVIDQFTKKHQNKERNPQVIILRGTRFQKYIQLYKLLSNSNADIIHFHTSLFRNYILGGFFLMKKINDVKSVLTIHSGRFVAYYEKKNPAWKYVVRKTLNLFDHIIALNEEQKLVYENKLNISATNISLIPSFLFPNDFRISNMKQMHKVNTFLNSVDFTMLVSGRLFELYGFELVLSATKRVIQQKNLKIGIIFIFYTAQDKNYKDRVMESIRDYPYTLVLKDLSPEEYLTILEKTHLYVRPTYSDGNSVSILEALTLKIPVLASDIGGRPEEVILFKTGSDINLADKLVYCIDNYSELKEQMEYCKLENNGIRILDIYYKLAQKDHRTEHSSLKNGNRKSF